MGSVWAELKRRNVVRVAIAYGVASWLLIQISATAFPMLTLPQWAGTLVTVMLIAGFPIALIFAWAYELTPEGLKKEKEIDRSKSITHVTGRKLDSVIIAVLAVAVTFLLVDRLILHEEHASADATVSSGLQSIAVLPFVNMSDDPNNEYFADGISEEILNLLADIPDLRVTSRSSAFSFKGQNVDIPTIAAKLNVAHILEGSVRKSGDQLRITTQLIEVASDAHLWSQTYDRQLDSIFAIQDEIATAVVDALHIELLGQKPKITETNPEAYSLYLQGNYLVEFPTEESIQRSETLLRRALEIDPGFAPAWVTLSNVLYFQYAIFGLRPIDEAAELARQAAQRALEIDPQFGRAHAALARIEAFYDWDFDGAAKRLQQALNLNPGDLDIMNQAAQLQVILGRPQEAIDIGQRAILVNPVTGHSELARTLYHAHRFEEAADSFEIALSLNPDAARNSSLLGLVWLALGDVDRALQETQEEGIDAYRLTNLVAVQHARGDQAASDAALEELIDRFADDSAYQIAMVYSYRGEIDNAYEWLEYAYDIRDAGMSSLLLDPMLDNVRNDPRWEALVDKMGLPNDL